MVVDSKIKKTVKMVKDFCYKKGGYGYFKVHPFTFVLLANNAIYACNFASLIKINISHNFSGWYDKNLIYQRELNENDVRIFEDVLKDNFIDDIVNYDFISYAKTQETANLLNNFFEKNKIKEFKVGITKNKKNIKLQGDNFTIVFAAKVEESTVA